MPEISDSNSEQGTKKCPDCGEEKPISEYWKNKRMPDGLYFYCKPCASARSGKTYRKRQAKQGKDARPWRQLVKAPEGMKYCPKCEQIKSLDEFGRNRANKSGMTDYCKPCHNAAGKETKQRLYGGTRHYHLQRRYGITAAEVDAMIAKQGGLCMICRSAKAEHVDHDHETGEVRGILCFNCNGGLGQFKDRRDVMGKAIAYLNGWQSQRPWREVIHQEWNVVLSVLDDEMEIYIAPDYAHS